MATVDADVDVRRDEWRAAKGVKHAREIRPVDGERGLSTIVCTRRKCSQRTAG